MELKGLKINFIGDSITEGVGASSYDKCYVAQFAAATGAIVRNYGISGTRIARRSEPYENPNFDRDFCGRFQQMDDDADLIVVFGGTNDYGHGDAPLGNMEDRDVWSFYGACHVLLSGLVAKYPDKPIIVLTPLHRIPKPNRPEELQRFVEVLRQVAEYYSMPVLDLWATSGMQPLVPEQHALYFADLVHPNDRGHAQIAYKLRRFLENL